MTHDDFRRIALGMKDAVESAHMDHPDFRVGNRIFATLHADNEWGMVILTPEQQQRFMEEAPKAFVPEKGAWGLQGCTAGTARRRGRGPARRSDDAGVAEPGREVRGDRVKDEAQCQEPVKR